MQDRMQELNAGGLRQKNRLDFPNRLSVGVVCKVLPMATEGSLVPFDDTVWEWV